MKYFVTSRLSENISETPEGFLLCLGVPIARTGEMVYGPGESPVECGPDGKAIVSRDAKEVFRPETIASFEGKAFTIKHPEEFVSPKNWSVLAKGHLQNVRRGTGEHTDSMLADILVTDADAIALVKGGVREVSCGYECEYIQTGIGRGMQSNIIGNHCALVEQGRAGASYAINDQQGAKMSKLSEKIKGIFAKAGDEAAKVVDDSGGTDKGEEVPKWAKQFMATVKDAMTEVASMSQPSKSADEDDKDEKDKKAKDKKAKDADKENESCDEEGEADPMEARMEKLEAKLDALMEKLSGGEDADEDDKDKDKSKDEDGEGEAEDADEEESEDDDFEESPANTKDEASRIEILAPGAKFSGKDAKRKALMKAYESKDSKSVIMKLSGGKEVDLKKASQKTIDHLFVGASEVVGIYRTKDFTKWKQVRDSQSDMDFAAGAEMTPEKINEMNAKHYKGAH